MKNKLFIYAASLTMVLFSKIAGNAQSSGTLDPSFANAGSYVMPFDPNEDLTVNDMKIGLDNKITFAGYVGNNNADIYLFRLNADGSPDVFFGNGGSVQLDPTIGGIDAAMEIYIQSDGKTIITGYSIVQGDIQLLVARLLLDGSFDPSFNNGAGFLLLQNNNNNTTGYHVVVDSNFDIIVLGDYISNGAGNMILYRFNEDGTVDNSFSGDGKKEIQFNAGPNLNEVPLGIRIDPDSKLYILGKDYNSPSNGLVARFTSNGEFDNTFDTDGKLIMAGNVGVDLYYNDFVINPAGELWIGAVSHPDGDVGSVMVQKFDAAGNVSNTYGTNGKAYFTPSANIDISTNFKMFRDGETITFGGSAVLNNVDVVLTGKFNAQGSVDNNYGLQGAAVFELENTVSAYVTTIGVQTTGKIIIGGAAGSSDYMPWASRLFNPGFVSIDENITTSFSVYPNPTTEAFQIRTENNEKVSKVSLINMRGQEVQTWNNVDGQYDLSNDLSNGVYTVRIQIGAVISNQLITINR